MTGETVLKMLVPGEIYFSLQHSVLTDLLDLIRYLRLAPHPLVFNYKKLFNKHPSHKTNQGLKNLNDIKPFK